MRTWYRGTERAFTVFICSGCAAGPGSSPLAELGKSIQRCPHGVLVSAPCLTGTLGCAARVTGPGAMAILQPCTRDRLPIGVPYWIGPIKDAEDTRATRAWIESGDWTVSTLPRGLRSPLNTLHSNSSRN